MALVRNLCYSDKYVIELTQDVPNAYTGAYTPLQFPDNTSPVSVTLTISLHDFTKILSALYTGADLSYPDQADDILYRFLNAFES